MIDFAFKVARRTESIFAGERGVIILSVVLFLSTLVWYLFIKGRSKLRIKMLLGQLNINSIAILLLLLVAGIYTFRVAMKVTIPVFIVMTYQRNITQEYPIPPEYWEINSLQIGDASFNSFGSQIAEVTDIKRSFWGSDRENVQLLVKIEAVRNSATGEFSFGGKPLLIGNSLSLTFGKTKFSGVISDIYEEQETSSWRNRRARAIVLLKGREYEQWHAEALRDFTVKNSKGEIVAATKDIRIEPAEFTSTTSDGRVYRLRDPIKRDVTLTLELSDVLCVEQTCYFEEFKPLKIGHDIWITSDKAVLPGMNIMDFSIEYIE